MMITREMMELIEAAEAALAEAKGGFGVWLVSGEAMTRLDAALRPFRQDPALDLKAVLYE